MEHGKQSLVFIYIGLVLITLLVISGMIIGGIVMMRDASNISELSKNATSVQENITQLTESIGSLQSDVDVLEEKSSTNNVNITTKEATDDKDTVISDKKDKNGLLTFQHVAFPFTFEYPSEWKAIAAGEKYSFGDGEGYSIETSKTEITLLSQETLEIFDDIARRELETEGPQTDLNVSFIKNSTINAERLKNPFEDNNNIIDRFTVNGHDVQMINGYGLYEYHIYIMQYGNDVIVFNAPTDSKYAKTIIQSVK